VIGFVFDIAADEVEIHDKECREYMLMELTMSLRAAADCPSHTENHHHATLSGMQIFLDYQGYPSIPIALT
jgi:hypothetical protein